MADETVDKNEVKKAFNWLVGIIFILIAILIFVWVGHNGLHEEWQESIERLQTAREAKKDELIKLGMAEWQIDKETGEKKLVYLPCTHKEPK